MSSTLTREPPVIGLRAGRPQARAPAQPEGRPVRARAAEDGLPAVAGHAPARHPVEEPGDVRGRGRHGADHHLHGRQAPGLPERGAHRLSAWPWISGSWRRCSSRTSPRPSPRPAARPRPTPCGRRGGPPRPVASGRMEPSEQTVSTDLRAGDTRGSRRRRGDPQRRRDHRRRGFHRRIGHHRRVGPRDPRGRRRPLGRHRRNARALRPDRGPDHGQPRQFVPRPHDRPGRRGHPPADAQRNRPVDRAGRVHADLPDRDRHALADGLQRRAVHEGLPRPRTSAS